MENTPYQEGFVPAYAASGMPMPAGAMAGYAPGAEHGGEAADYAGYAGYAGYGSPAAPMGPLAAPSEGPAMTAAAAEPCAEPRSETDEGQNKYQYMGRKPAQNPAQDAASAPSAPAAAQGPSGYVAQGPSGYAKGYFQPASGENGQKPQAAPGAPAEHVCSCGGHEAQAPGKPEAVPGAQYAAPQGPQYGPQYAAPQGPQSAPQQGAQHAAPQGPQYAAPQGPQYAPQQGAQYAAPQGPQYAAPQEPQYAPQFGAQYAAPQGPQYAPGPEAAAPHEQEEGEGKKGHCHGHGGHEQQEQQAQPGFFGFPGFGGLGGFTGAAGSPGEDPKHLEYRYGQMMELCNDIMQGKADPSKIAAFLTSTGAHFWKGAVVGAAVTFLLTNSAVKSALGDTFSTIFSAAKGGE